MRSFASRLVAAALGAVERERGGVAYAARGLCQRVQLGRHSGDGVTSFYTHNPSGFLVEYGWGGQVIDDETWQPFERKFGPSFWGHERRWMSAEQREQTRRISIEGAEAGQRMPVQVIAGNYHLMPGVCPWWDAMKQAGKAAG